MTNSASLTESVQLRRMLRAKRRALTSSEQNAAAENLATNFFRRHFHLRYKKIGVYWPTDGEISPLPLVHQLLTMRKECYLPILHPLGIPRVHFSRFIPGDSMYLNRFGIPEPSGMRAESIRALDLILMPLVGFDPSGNRMGMGAGFYDRSLAFTRRQNLGPTLIGLAHSCQRVDVLLSKPWDIPMTGILTDAGYIAAK